MQYYSILRDREYKALSKLLLNGSVLDVGGGARTKYHDLIRGEHSFHSINISPSCNPNTLADIEKPFPFADDSFDHAICLNVLEHIYEFEHVVREVARCVKPGGLFVIATPFMHHVHGSPDDYLRYTDSAFRRMADKNGYSVTSIEKLGTGFFSLGFQCFAIGAPKVLWVLTKPLALGLDGILNTLSARYRKLTELIPLGYFVILTKK